MAITVDLSHTRVTKKFSSGGGLTTAGLGGRCRGSLESLSLGTPVGLGIWINLIDKAHASQVAPRSLVGWCCMEA